MAVFSHLINDKQFESLACQLYGPEKFKERENVSKELFISKVWFSAKKSWQIQTMHERK